MNESGRCRVRGQAAAASPPGTAEDEDGNEEVGLASIPQYAYGNRSSQAISESEFTLRHKIENLIIQKYEFQNKLYLFIKTNNVFAWQGQTWRDQNLLTHDKRKIL